MTNLLPRLTHMDAFTVSGLSVRTINSDEFNQTTAKLPYLWGQFLSSGNVESVPKSNSLVYGVYSDYDTDETGFYTVTAGVTGSLGVSIPDSRIVQVSAGDYLVFEGKGNMPQVVVETWQKVWRFFTENIDYKRKFTTDFELYRGPDDIAIYIGVS